MMNIVLIGARCSGKTTTGKIIAHELRRAFLDTDALIEVQAGCSIETMLSKEGWDHFRNIEKKMVREVSGKDNLVIGTGGGVVLDGDNVKNLKERGWLVWLNADPEVLQKRMAKEQKSGKIRPSLTGDDPIEEVKAVLEERAPLYEHAADMVVDTTTLIPKEAAAFVLKALPQRA